MVLVESFCFLFSTKQVRVEELDYAKDGLYEDEYIGDHAENAVRGFEVRAWMAGFVDLYDYKGDEEAEKSKVCECGVDISAELLLGRGMRWLKNEERLREEK
jgi:hypothetical protein